MEIYIVFGDRPRSDGDNIEGIFFTRKRAEEFVNVLDEMSDGYNSYTIEEHEVE